MGAAKVRSIPEISCNHVDAALMHEAAIGKIAGEQLLKLETLGLTPEEAEDVRSQIVTLSGESARSAWWRYPPRAFTEQGVAMLSAVLRGAKAVEVSIGIMDAFVEMSPFSSREDLAALLTA